MMGAASSKHRRCLSIRMKTHGLTETLMKNNVVFLCGISIMALVIGGVGCNLPAEGTVENNATEQNAAVAPTTPVEVVTPERGTIAAHFETTARIEAENRVEVLSKGTGECMEVRVDVGDVVDVGQVLALLERDELDAQVRQARINVQQQETALEIAERSYEEGIVSSIDRDNARFALNQARVNLELAELQLRNQTIRAPIAGVITKRLIQRGMVVTPGVPVFSIVDADSFVLPIQVPEKELARFTAGQEAEARIDAAPDRVFQARVRRIYPSIDPTSGTVRVLLDFEESDRPLLREAAFARVRLVMESRNNALLAPRDAVFEEEGRNYVFLVEAQHAGDDTDTNESDVRFFARRREITLGLEHSDRVEVLDGLTDDALIVTMGQHSLKPDAPVVITSLEDELAKRASVTLDEALEAAVQRETTVSGDRSRHTHDSLAL